MKKKNLFTSKLWQWGFIGTYLIAILTCFICNIAIDHKLTWFYIVLVSTCLSFCITNLPFYFKKHGVVISALFVTILTYLLLWTCQIYAPGDWLYKIAFPIVTLELVFVWILLLTIIYLKINLFLKFALISLIVGIIEAVTNPFCNYLISQTNPLDDSISTLIGSLFVLLAIFLTILGLINLLKNKSIK